MVLNPRVINKAKQWIVEEYRSVIFKYPNENKTSVNKEEFSRNTKHNEDLKNFLQLILQQKGAEKVKKYGKKMKSYAQALGMNLNIKENKKNPKKDEVQQKKES